MTDVMDRSEMARQLAAMRKQVTKRCKVCGELTTGTAKRLYCSDLCRQRAHYRGWVDRHRLAHEVKVEGETPATFNDILELMREVRQGGRA